MMRRYFRGGGQERRGLLWRGVVLAAVLLAVELLPWGWYAVPGLLRGEHFYRALPTSYWRKCARDWLAHAPPGRSSGPALLGRLAGYLGLNRASPPVLNDRAAVPVLVDLLDESDPDVRAWAANTVGIGPAGAEAVPALIAALSDPDWRVRSNAMDSLAGMQEAGLPAVPALAGLIGNAYPPAHSSFDDPVYPLLALRRLGPGVVPGLVNALRHEDSRVRLGAAAALRAIDPKAAARVASTSY
jgi:hypothetical protein